MPSPTPERNPVEKLSEEFLERHRRGSGRPSRSTPPAIPSWPTRFATCFRP